MKNDTPSAERSASARNVTGLRLIEHPSGHLVKHVVLAHLDVSEVPTAVEAFEYLRRERERSVPQATSPTTRQPMSPSTIELVDVLTGDVLAAGHGPIELDLEDSGLRARTPRHIVNNPKCEACLHGEHSGEWHPWLTAENAASVEEVTGRKLCDQRCGCPCAGDWYTIRVGSPRR